MIRILITITILLGALANTFACTCIPPTFTEKYMSADFVARARITKTYANNGSQLYYKSGIVIQELYKGNPVTSVLVEGSSDGKKRTSCDIFIPKNTELLIYARKNGQGQYIFDSCSGYLILDKSRPSTEAREMAMLNSLRAKNINYTEKTSYNVRFDDLSKAFKGVTLDKSFGIYEVTFASDLRVKSVSIVDGFNPELDAQLIDLLKQSKWVSTAYVSEDIINRNRVREDSKLLVGFYYYKAEGRNESFIGEYDL